MRSAFLVAILSFSTLNCFGLDLGNFFAPPGPAKNSIRYIGTQYQTKNNKNQPDDTGMHNEELFFSLPVSQDKTDVWQVQGRARLLNVDTNGVLPDNNVAIPEQFWDVGLGGSYKHNYEDESFLSFSVNGGSASDKPFATYSVSTIDASAFYGFKTSEKSRWLLLLNYSNNRPILNNIPFPGVAYFYTPSKTFRATFGLPFASVYWEPFESAAVSFFILAPWFIRSELSYRVVGPLQLFTGFEFFQTLYIRKDRADESDRFFYNDKRFIFGVRSPISSAVRLSLTSGYSFDRQLYEGSRYDRPTSGILEVGSGFYVQWGLNASF